MEKAFTKINTIMSVVIYIAATYYIKMWIYENIILWYYFVLFIYLYITITVIKQYISICLLSTLQTYFQITTANKLIILRVKTWYLYYSIYRVLLQYLPNKNYQYFTHHSFLVLPLTVKNTSCFYFVTRNIQAHSSAITLI